MIFERLAMIMYNAASKRLGTVPDGKVFSYGIGVREKGSNKVIRDFIIMIFSNQVTLVTRESAPRIIATFTQIDQGDMKSKIQEELNTIKNSFEPHGIMHNIYLRLVIAGEANEHGFFSATVAEEDEAQSKINKVIRFYEELKEVHNPPTSSVFGGTNRILYKGYYYKIRKDGKKQYIQTKHEGQVSLSQVKRQTTKI
jgi:hypothetical protein